MVGTMGLQRTPKAGSFLFTKGGDWTGTHLSCTQKVTLGLFPFVINKYIMRRCFEITFVCA